MCTQLKIHGISNEVINSIVPEASLILAQLYFLLDGPGVSFIAGIVCPQASQMCCDSDAVYLFEKNLQPQKRKECVLKRIEKSVYSQNSTNLRGMYRFRKRYFVGEKIAKRCVFFWKKKINFSNFSSLFLFCFANHLFIFAFCIYQNKKRNIHKNFQNFKRLVKKWRFKGFTVTKKQSFSDVSMSFYGTLAFQNYYDAEEQA